MNLRHFLAGSAVFLALSGAAWAAEGSDVLLRAFDTCAAVTDGTARLACYDRLAPRVKDALAEPPQSVATAHPPTVEEQKSWFGFDIGDLFGTSPATQTTPQQFGAENTAAVKARQESQKPKQIESITAGVTEYAYTPFGKFIVFLDNGQVWRQIPGDSDHAYFARKASDNTVRLSRGLLGSYQLQINGSERVYKVTRIK